MKSLRDDSALGGGGGTGRILAEASSQALLVRVRDRGRDKMGVLSSWAMSGATHGEWPLGGDTFGLDMLTPAMPATQPTASAAPEGPGTHTVGGRGRRAGQSDFAGISGPWYRSHGPKWFLRNRQQ